MTKKDGKPNKTLPLHRVREGVSSAAGYYAHSGTHHARPNLAEFESDDRDRGSNVLRIKANAFSRLK